MTRTDEECDLKVRRDWFYYCRHAPVSVRPFYDADTIRIALRTRSLPAARHQIRLRRRFPSPRSAKPQIQLRPLQIRGGSGLMQPEALSVIRRRIVSDIQGRLQRRRGGAQAKRRHLFLRIPPKPQCGNSGREAAGYPSGRTSERALPDRKGLSPSSGPRTGCPRPWGGWLRKD